MWQNKIKTLIYIFIKQEKQIKPTNKHTVLQIVINNFLFCFN